jgi:hypothetical protein
LRAYHSSKKAGEGIRSNEGVLVGGVYS